jgi:hypothetical protein
MRPTRRQQRGIVAVLVAIGLLALLHQAGVPVPARDDSTLPVFECVVADLGDEQSIEAAESTFSSHLRHVVNAVRRAGPRTLVLLDEFMAGTDPDEGAALAQVVLRRLVEPGGTTLVTSHLAALKLLAHSEPGVANAGMLFDAESRTPLYRLQPGVPGSSNALATVDSFPADNAAVTFIGAASTQYPQNLVYHKDAITLATADLLLPQGVDMASRQVHNGISLRIVRQYDINNDRMPCRIDVLYGYSVIRPAMACRLWG